jgi:hypothetical protein
MGRKKTKRRVALPATVPMNRMKEEEIRFNPDEITDDGFRVTDVGRTKRQGRCGQQEGFAGY